MAKDPNLNLICKPLYDRLKKNNLSWFSQYNLMVQQIKKQVNEHHHLYIANPESFKIVETHASKFGCDGILKQLHYNHEQLIHFTSKHWNGAHKIIYSIIEKEILAIMVSILESQSDLISSQILPRNNCKLAKDILQKKRKKNTFKSCIKKIDGKLF